MDAPNLLFPFLLSTLILYSSSASGEKQTLRWSRKHTTEHDATFPTIVTVPSSTPTTTTPPSAPVITNPVVSPPVTIGAPPAAPVTNPNTPAVAPPATTAGQRWCVAKTGAPDKSIQAALDYACGIGAADCYTIQQGASCYNPNTLQNHASYAFNSYYQRNPLPTSCDFGGAAALTASNPSSGSCVYAASATTVSTTPTAVSPPTTVPPVSTSPSVTPPTMPSPVIVNPTPITPTTTTTPPTGASPTGLGIPPSILNSSNPGMGGATAGFGIGDGSPVANMTTAISVSSKVEPFVGSIVAVATIVVLGM